MTDIILGVDQNGDEYATVSINGNKRIACERKQGSRMYFFATFNSDGETTMFTGGDLDHINKWASSYGVCFFKPVAS